MDEQNFCAQNVVGMSLTFWCASSETAAADTTRGALRVLSLPAAALRPVVCFPGATGETTYRQAAASAGIGGVKGVYTGPVRAWRQGSRPA